MIRFDTFRFDYDAKNVILFSRAVVVLLVRHALLLRFCGLAWCQILANYQEDQTVQL
jgi:hypothetical protein